MNSKLPAMQFYPGDWRKDPGVQSLCYHDRGVWFEMLCLMHESEDRGKLMLNGNPMPHEALARLLGLDNQILTTTLTTLIDFGVASLDKTTKAIISRRMVRDEEIRRIRKSCGKMGGNPNLLIHKSTTQDNQIPTPSSSSSSSEGDQEKRGRSGNFEKPAKEAKINGFHAEHEKATVSTGNNGITDANDPKPEPKADKEPSRPVLNLNTTPTITDTEKVPPRPLKPAKAYPEQSIEYQSAAAFYDDFLKVWAPTAKKPSEATVQGWAKEYDLMVRVDGRNWTQIRDVLNWIDEDQGDSRSGFAWKKNILSVSTLRQRWNEGKLDQLIAKGRAKLYGHKK